MDRLAPVIVPLVDSTPETFLKIIRTLQERNAIPNLAFSMHSGPRGFWCFLGVGGSLGLSICVGFGGLRSLCVFSASVAVTLLIRGVFLRRGGGGWCARCCGGVSTMRWLLLSSGLGALDFFVLLCSLPTD